MFRTSLFDESDFYQNFILDSQRANREVIIESPFITLNRVRAFSSVFERLVNKSIPIHIITRDPRLHSNHMARQAETCIQYFEQIGIQSYTTTNLHHRKLALIDRNILWEGSLNILSQSNSREVMRRIEGDNHAQEMFDFLGLGKIIK